MRPYLLAYAAYYDRLTPEEQQTDRYRGTGDAAKKALGDAAPAATAAADMPESRSQRAAALLSAQAQYAANDPSAKPDTRFLAGPDLLSGLRSLLGVIQVERHPAAPKLIAIPPHVDVQA